MNMFKEKLESRATEAEKERDYYIYEVEDWRKEFEREKRLREIAEANCAKAEELWRATKKNLAEARGKQKDKGKVPKE